MPTDQRLSYKGNIGNVHIRDEDILSSGIQDGVIGVR